MLLLLVILILTAVVGMAGAPDTASAAVKAPAGLKASSVTATSMGLTWSAVPQAPKYRVKYSISSKFTAPKYSELTGQSTTISSLEPGIRYYVKVRVVSTDGTGLSSYSKAIQVQTAEVSTPTASSSAALRVASYNVRCANCYDGAKDEGTWAQRREAVVATILSQHLDVIGVQEASQGRLYDSETGSKNLSQFEDLTARLGGSWKLTNTKRYNCVKDTSPNNCAYAYQGASRGTRILYDSARIDLLDAGSALIPKPASDDERSVAWATLRQRDTGRSFVFSNVHLSADGSKNYQLRKSQAQAAVAAVKAHNSQHLPVIAVGDWNSSRFADPTNAPYDVYIEAGFVDPLGGAYRTTKTAPGATVQHRIQTWVSSSNRFTRMAPAHQDWINGSYIDYLMTTPMRVSEWETVADLDKSGNFIGLIPSDHNLIRATVWLPA